MKKPIKKQTLVFHTAINSFTGYGILTINLFRKLRDRGYNVRLRPLGICEDFGTAVPDDIKKMVSYDVQKTGYELVFHPPRYVSEYKQISSGLREVLYTMWETTKVPKHWVDDLNTLEALITPTEWNRQVLLSSGVTKPIIVSPLGIDTEVFHPDISRFPKECVFGTAGRVAHGYSRKGIDTAIKLFLEEFPIEGDVRLNIKCFPDCKIRPIYDSRILVTRACIDEKSMVEWYQDLTAYLDCTTAEGFGLHQLEANACGKICIGADFSGKVVYNNQYNITVPFTLVRCPIKDPYECTGKWASLDEQAFRQKMRYVYENRQKVLIDGFLGRECTKGYTIDNMVDSYVQSLKTLGVLE